MLLWEEMGEWELVERYVPGMQKLQIKCLPYKQKQLERSDDSTIDKNKEHPQHLCGKCQQLGYYCRREDSYY